MCEEHGIDRTTGLTEAQFRELIFDGLDPADRTEMRELFDIYERVVRPARRERIPDDVAAGTPPTLPVQSAAPVDLDVPPRPLGLPPASVAPHLGAAVRLAAGGDGDLEPCLDTLQEMGFSRHEASRALEIAHGSVERAAMLLSTGELAELMSDDEMDDDDGVARLGGRGSQLSSSGDSDEDDDVARLGSRGSQLSSSGSDQSGDEGGLLWRTRDEFPDDAHYGAYIKATLRAGMRVRARCHAEGTIENGDEGIYLQTNGGEPPCQVQWDRYGGKYWVQWFHVEIIQPADAARQDAGARREAVRTRFAHIRGAKHPHIRCVRRNRAVPP